MAGLDAFGVRFEREETIDGEDYVAIANITSLGGPSITREQLDVTAHDSPEQWEEIIFGIKRTGEVSADLNYDPPIHDLLMTDFDTSEPRNYRIIWPDPEETTWHFKAGLVSFEPDAPHDDKLTASASFKISGKPDFLNDES
jgi:predicted secreted protein